MNSCRWSQGFALALLVLAVNTLAAPPRPGAGRGQSIGALGEDENSVVAGEIARVRELWLKEWNARETAMIMTLYAPDASFLTARGERVTGQAAIRNLFDSMRNSSAGNLRLYSATTEESGDLAYDSGAYRETMLRPDGTPHEVEGNYLTVYRRQPAGNWLIVQQVWTPASPPRVRFKPLTGESPGEP